MGTSSRSSVGIYQPVFSAGVRPFLDPGFIELDWRHNPAPPLREFAIHRHICEAGILNRHDLTGVLSPKFFSKTRLTSREVKDWIAANPGHELYCIDGRPFVPYLSYNSMERAAVSHPSDFEDRMRQVCRAIGFNLPIELGRQIGRQTILCNYWVATPGFWERWWREIILPIAGLRQTDEALARAVFKETPYRSPTPVFLISFIYERIMSHFIENKGIDAAMFPFNTERILDLDYHPRMKQYLIGMLPWVDDVDRRGHWTAEERAKLAAAYADLRSVAGLTAHEANTSDPLNFDLPARKPPQA